MPPRRYRAPVSRTPEPPWLPPLRAALFAHPSLPAAEDAFLYEGMPCLCRRTLDDDGARLLFREVVLDPFTHQVRHTWAMEVQAGAFAGSLPPAVFAQQVDLLAGWLVGSRPTPRPRPRETPFVPGRFAHQRGLPRR
jgi:hypothetical protein